MILINYFGTFRGVYVRKSLIRGTQYRYVTEQVTIVNSKLGSFLFLVNTSEVILATPVFRGATSG